MKDFVQAFELEKIDQLKSGPYSAATQLTHYKTNSFAIQNHASHITVNSGSPGRKSGGSSQPAAH